MHMLRVGMVITFLGGFMLGDSPVVGGILIGVGLLLALPYFDSTFDKI